MQKMTREDDRGHRRVSRLLLLLFFFFDHSLRTTGFFPPLVLGFAIALLEQRATGANLFIFPEVVCHLHSMGQVVR